MPTAMDPTSCAAAGAPDAGAGNACAYAADTYAADAYVIVIADLKRRRDELDRMIRQLEAVMGEAPPATAMAARRRESASGKGRDGGRAARREPFGKAPEVKGEFTGMKVAEACRILLARQGAAMSPSDITAGLEHGGLRVAGTNTVTSVLNRQRREVGDVVSPRRGLWALTTDWPDADKPAESAPTEISGAAAGAADDSPPPDIAASHATARDTNVNAGHAAAGEDAGSTSPDILAPYMPTTPASPPWQPPVFNMADNTQE